MSDQDHDKHQDVGMSLLRYMGRMADAALAGKPEAQPYLDAGAMRIVDGQVEFHQLKFVEVTTGLIFQGKVRLG